MSNLPITRGTVPGYRNQRSRHGEQPARHTRSSPWAPRPEESPHETQQRQKKLGNANSKAAKDVAIHIANERLVRINEDSLFICKGKQENCFFFFLSLDLKRYFTEESIQLANKHMRTHEDTQTQQGNENKTQQQYIFIRIATVIKK